jgi:fimbrial chaperone protein
LVGRALLLVIAAGLGILPGPGRVLAQTLQVTPIQVELTTKARNAVVTLQNLGSEPMRLQASAFAWDQGPRGEMRLSRTKDVTFFPGLFTIAPGEKRSLRIAAATPPGAVEKTYRVFVEQLPQAATGADTAVRVLTRVGIPVYVEPPQPSRAAELSALRLEAGKIVFTVRNTGSVRLRPEAVLVSGRDADGELVFERSLEAWYVLAGGERIFELEAPRDRCARVRSLSAEVKTEAGVLTAQAATAGGACAP